MDKQIARRIPITKVLDHLGHQPTGQFIHRDGSLELQYFSPFRKESKASFWVNTARNVYNDFGFGGGNVIDLVIAYYNIDFKRALSYLEAFTEGWVEYSEKSLSEGHKSAAEDNVLSSAITTTQSPTNQFQFWAKDKLHYYPIKRYIQNRKIEVELASIYLYEVDYYKTGQPQKLLKGIGMPNASGGYEIRGFGNDKFHTVLRKKDISIFEGRKTHIADIFESAFDFLSFLQLSGQRKPDGFSIVLHSSGLVPRAIEKIKTLPECLKIRAWMDNDTAGQDATQQLQTLEQDGYKVFDMRYRYAQHKDLNEWVVKGD